MIEADNKSIQTTAKEAGPPDGITNSQSPVRRFDGTDWLGFGVATSLVLAGYLYTLTPDVTLEWSGIFATSAMYAGVSGPPGYPLWGIYGWLFTVLLPFSNIAWRTAVATAVAGALTCGLVALLVSQAGSGVLAVMDESNRISKTDRKCIRIVCGSVAGLGFGFSGTVWQFAIEPDAWPLSLLLFMIVLCLLTKWSLAPDRRRWLYAASFCYGLTLTNSQALAVAAPALLLLVVLADRELGRDALFLVGLFLCLLAYTAHAIGPASNFQGYLFPTLYLALAMAAFVAGTALAALTRRVLLRSHIVLLCGLMCLLGLGAYFYLPLASMTTPPNNWGYTRTVEGFIHVLTRGQYERAIPRGFNVQEILRLTLWYVNLAFHEFGGFYLLFALIPFCCWRKLAVRERNWMFGWLGVFLCLSVLMLFLLNPSARENYAFYVNTIMVTASFPILAIWSGLGLVMLAAFIARRGNARCSPAGRTDHPSERASL